MHIYFCGIGGAALSPLAQMALDCGFEVSGSEREEGLGTKELQSRGINYHLGQTGQEIAQIHKQKPIDWFVHTSAVSQNHEEFQFAQKNGIKISKRDELLNFILAKFNLKMIAVAGTHGKTTTTAMLVWLFKQFQVPVSYSIGSQISFGPSAQYESGSEYFIYECDEFDRNFLNFFPHESLITSLDYDHPDTYPTKEFYYLAFEQFITQSKKTALYYQDLKKMNLDYLPNQSEWAKFKPTVADFAVTLRPEKDRPIRKRAFRLSAWTQVNEKIALHGLHNRRNGTLALWLAGCMSKSLVPNKFSSRGKLKEKMIQVLNEFPGTYRRFEKLGENLYSDYAHHPTEIAATIQLAREIIDQKNQP